jgi:hypothetical protein
MKELHLQEESKSRRRADYEKQDRITKRIFVLVFGFLCLATSCRIFVLFPAEMGQGVEQPPY